MIRNLTVVAVVLVLVMGGLVVVDFLRAPSHKIVIFYTSNLRGQIKPFSGTVLDRQFDRVGGLAFIRGFIDDCVEKFNFDPQEIVLLDTGDALFGSAEASLTLGEAPFELMVKAGYDAMAVGNLEFEIGLDNLRRFAKTRRLPFLAANYRDLKSGLEETFLPGRIIERNGVKIGIVGLGHMNLPRITSPENILTIEVNDLESSVQRSAAALKMQGAELVILLSHHPMLDAHPNLSGDFPDVDIIIGDLIGPPVLHQKRPMLCQTAPARGGGIGMVKVSRIGGHWDIENAFQRLFSVDSANIRPDSMLANEISRLEAKVDTLLEQIVAFAEGDFTRAYSDECAIGNLITDSMRIETGADVALQNSGGIKAELASGAISLRHLYDLLPFENAIVTMRLKGWQLENLLEDSLSGAGSFLQCSGVRCTFSSANPRGFRIIQVDVGEEPLEFNQEYLVAVSDYMTQNPVAWPDLRHSKELQVYGQLRETLKDFLAEQGTVIRPRQRRFHDFQADDETLRLQALSFELVSLSRPISHDGTVNSEYGRLLADIMRTETAADFAILPADTIQVLNEPLQVLTPAGIIGDIPDNTEVSTVTMTGSVLQKILQATVTSQQPPCFSGFSVEMLPAETAANVTTDDTTGTTGTAGVHGAAAGQRMGKIHPWSGTFAPENLYKVAVTTSFPLIVEGVYDISQQVPDRMFSDIRRLLLNGMRIREGKVELRRALL